jgi:zinc D-Ala-D-Ala carboxypeptidase
MRHYTFIFIFAAFLCFVQCRQAAVAPMKVPQSPVSNKIDASVGQDYLMGRFDQTTHPNFVLLKAPHTDRPGMYLRRETAEAFQKMYDAAKKEGVVLNIISSTRTFEQQKGIWERKWQRYATEIPEAEARARKIMEYSAMPGASRHHWGTDIDLNDLNNPTFEGKGKYRKVYDWLSAHAAEYGFGQPYTPKGTERPHGYNEEKWHWSYLPLSKPLLAEYNRTLTDAAIEGFIGSESAKSIGIVQHYVNGINPTCK